MRTLLLVAALWPMLSGCSGSSGHPEPFYRYEQRPLTDAERELLIQHVESVIGQPYAWGGDTIEGGFDCSGLIQWTFRQLGFGQFRNADEVHREITAHDMYHFNTQHIASLEELKRGDFIFFDENGDGRITHNSVFDRIEDGLVWVYDAYSIEGQVLHRYVQGFSSKGPLFGTPLKTVPKSFYLEDVKLTNIVAADELW